MRERRPFARGYEFTLNDANYTEGLKPKFYYALAGVVFGVNFLAVLLTVGVKSNLFGSQADGQYIDAVLQVKQSKFYRGYARLTGLFILLFAVIGFSVSDGGLPKTDPLKYWLLMLVALKQLAGPAGKPPMNFFEVRTESFITAKWAKRWFETCEGFESDIASAKLTYREDYVNEVFAEGTPEENIKVLNTFVNMRSVASTLKSNVQKKSTRGRSEERPHIEGTEAV